MVGRTVSHYQITERLGAGGMGEIYKAIDTRLNRPVAIKVLAVAQTGTGERRARFLQEARAASALNHPNIITIHDIVSDGESECLVMEFVAGKTLGELIPRGGLPMTLVLSYAVQIADALEAAHGAGIVHRDLKPANVMITGQSDESRPGLVKLLDFGLAKLTSPLSGGSLSPDETATLARAPLTVEGSIMGTLSYMSPEQAEGKPVDARSDIFAFGAILHEMVTGERAFAGDSAISTLTAILRDEVRPMRQMTTDVSPVLESIVARCMRKNREERWQSMQEVRAALAMLKRDSDSGISFLRPPPPPAPPPPPPRKKMGLPMVLALAGFLPVAGTMVLVAAIVLWALLFHSSHSRTPRNPSRVTVSAGGVTVEDGKVTIGVPAGAPGKTADDGVLTNDGVITMVNADVPAKVIVDHIRSSKTRFNLSTSEVIRLTEQDVPADVIAAMREAARTAAAAPATAAKTAPAPETIPAPGGRRGRSPACPSPTACRLGSGCPKTCRRTRPRVPRCALPRSATSAQAASW